jgi:hypothetical protein
MHHWANFNFSKLRTWYYDMFSFKLMICCYYVTFTLQLVFLIPTLKASGLMLIHVYYWVYVFFFSYCVHWIMLCLLTYALHVLLWFLYYMPFVLSDIGWWKWIIPFGCLSESMKVFQLFCLSIATIWMKLNVVIWIHHWMKLNVMYIHWGTLTFCVTSNFGFSKIFRIKEPRVLSKIL